MAIVAPMEAIWEGTSSALRLPKTSSPLLNLKAMTYLPKPEFDFPGLKPGDHWCLCALRWKEAWQAGWAPLVVLASCEESALEIVPLDVLKMYATTSK